MKEPTVTLRDPYRAAFLAWLVPGLGHFYQGRTGKGILYAVCILGLYLMGMVMGEGKIVYWRWVNPFSNPEKFCIYYPGQFFVGLPALPALIQSTLQYYHFDPTHHFLWGFMAEPAANVLNGLQPRLGKLVEIGTIYTAVAGLLNILAIYDAYEGPAYQDYEEDSATRPASPALPAGGLRAEGSA
jgi:TM2 domain-containing membrane protein YozV